MSCSAVCCSSKTTKEGVKDPGLSFHTLVNEVTSLVTHTNTYLQLQTDKKRTCFEPKCSVHCDNSSKVGLDEWHATDSPYNDGIKVNESRMVTCAVSRCKNTSAKISKNKDGITFHRFPRDKERRKRWEIAVNREHEWTSTSSSAVCSQHFDANNFYLTESGLRRLSGEAVPTMNISPFEEQQPTISELKPIDIKPNDSGEVIELKYKVRRLEVIADNRKKRLNLMWQSKRRMRKKLERLKSMIKHLVQSKKSDVLRIS